MLQLKSIIPAQKSNCNFLKQLRQHNLNIIGA